jgi:hypothetical protein
MGDQPVARSLPIQTQTNIYALSGIRTRDLSVRASEDSSCLDRAATVSGGGTSVFIKQLEEWALETSPVGSIRVRSANL